MCKWVWTGCWCFLSLCDRQTAAVRRRGMLKAAAFFSETYFKFFTASGFSLSFHSVLYHVLCEGCGTLYLIIWFKEGVFITCGMLGILSSNLSVMRRQHTNTWMKSFVVWPDIHFSKCDFFSMTVSAGISEWGRGGHRIMFKGVLKKGGGRTSRRDAGKQTFIKLQIYACGPQTLLESCDWLIDWLIFFSAFWLATGVSLSSPSLL